MSVVKRNFIGVLAIVFMPFLASAATTRSISQFGITWEFKEPREYGQFVNGDYWVVGPVTVTNMLPAWDGTNHGWEINPTVTTAQGFDRNGASYSDSKRPEMPFTITTNASLVKVISKAVPNASEIQTAAVLTILNSAPPNGGTNYFRPPYVGTNKPLYQVSDLQTNLLPSYPMVPNATTMTGLVAAFSKCLRMDHHSSRPREFRPEDAMENYQPKNTMTLNNSMLRLILDDPIAEKMQGLILFTQHAMDRAYIISLGYRSLDDGHNPNQRILAAWGAVMLDIKEIKDYMATATGFHEDNVLCVGQNGAVLWGTGGTESSYWSYIRTGSGNKSQRDPYGYIDGGGIGALAGREVGYQAIVSQSLKGSACVARLFPQLQACFPAPEWARLSSYAERWVTTGFWTQPDPVAPYDGVAENYGVTFGPDGSGSFIAGSGRRPDRHGGSADGGQYKSGFVASMWDAYTAVRKPPAPSGLRFPR